MKNPRLFALVGLLFSIVLSTLLITFVLARPLAKLTGVAESLVVWSALVFLLLLSLIRIYLIIKGRDPATNFIEKNLTKKLGEDI